MYFFYHHEMFIKMHCKALDEHWFSQQYCVCVVAASELPLRSRIPYAVQPSAAL